MTMHVRAECQVDSSWSVYSVHCSLYILYSVHYTACKVGGDYRSRVEEREREKEGWLKKAVFNEA